MGGKGRGMVSLFIRRYGNICQIVAHSTIATCLLVITLSTCVDATRAEPRLTPPGQALLHVRHVDASLASMTLKRFSALRLLAPEDLPPFSWRVPSGGLRGHAVAVARALCAEARIRCTFRPLPWRELAPALARGEGDAIIAGLRMTPRAFAAVDFTRPYLKALGVFAARRDAAPPGVDARALAGRRIAVVAGTVHEHWLRRAYGRSRIQAYPDFARAAGALRAAKADVLFGDWLQVEFWTLGKASGGCCAVRPGWFAARDFAWNSTAMAVRRGNVPLRHFLDRYLDEMDASGQLGLLARRHLPALPVISGPSALR